MLQLDLYASITIKLKSAGIKTQLTENFFLRFGQSLHRGLLLQHFLPMAISLANKSEHPVSRIVDTMNRRQ